MEIANLSFYFISTSVLAVSHTPMCRKEVPRTRSDPRPTGSSLPAKRHVSRPKAHSHGRCDGRHSSASCFARGNPASRRNEPRAPSRSDSVSALPSRTPTRGTQSRNAAWSRRDCVTERFYAHQLPRISCSDCWYGELADC